MADMLGMSGSYWMTVASVLAIGGASQILKGGRGSAARNADVARAWSDGHPASADNFMTDGQTLFSYRLPIGVTRKGRKVLYNYTASGEFKSKTTSQHVSKAKHYADEVVAPPG